MSFMHMDATTASVGLFEETIVIGNSTGPVNLRTLANNHTPAYNGTDNVLITYTIAGGVLITGAANGFDALITGSWSAGSIDLTLENAGTIRGGGGRGGNGAFTFGNGVNGGTGGDAINATVDLTVDNAGGVIEAAGGGGGGGSGGLSGEIERGGGGGGGGYPNGSGGTGRSIGGQNGSAGTTGGGGSGGSAGSGAGAGGGGGDVNANGAAGTAGNTGSPGGSGSRGFAVRKNGNTVTVTGGTVTGQQG